MVSLLNNLIMLFIQTEIKSSFMHQIWRLRGRGDACQFYSDDERIFVTDLILLPIGEHETEPYSALNRI